MEMETTDIKPGIPVILQELEPSSEYFKQGASLRVTGRLQAYNEVSFVAVVADAGVSLKVDTHHLKDPSLQNGSIYQFIGELLIQPDNDAILQARIVRNVDGLDLNLYHQSLLLLRQFEAELTSSRVT